MGDTQRRETSGTVEIAVELTAAVWCAGSIGHVLYTGRSLSLPETVVLVVVMAIIAVGEQIRVRMVGVQEHAPVAEGAALALATTAVLGQRSLDLPAPVVIIAVSVATALGCLLRARRLRITVSAYYLAVRVHVITLAAVAFRWLPVAGGDSLVSTAATASSAWVAAALIALIVVTALALGLVLAGIHSSAALGAGMRAALRDELTVGWYLHLTTAVTATIIALGAHALGPWSYPAMLMPLVLVQVAMSRKAALLDTKRQTVRALSQLPEVGGYTIPGHVARVAELATAMGRELRLAERELLDLEHAARLHDVGQVGLRIPLPGGATVEAAPNDQQAIASNGARILAEAGDGPNVLAIVERQAASYRRMRELGEEIPLAARILKVANAFDDFSQGRRDARFRETAVERISLGLGYEYDPLVFRALLAALGDPGARPVTGRR